MLTNLSLKLIVLLHDKNLKFLEPKDQLTESQLEQPTAEIKTVCKSGPAKRKLATSGSQTSQMDVITAEQQPEATVSQQNGSKLVVVCDSIPKLVKPNDVSSSLPCEVQHVAPTVNEATDFVQDSAKLSDILLVHSGTNNIRKESYVTVNNRFDRLETNIKHRKLKCVALSSVVYRNNWFLDSKIKMVNNHIRSICALNDWVYVDNDNIDESCLSPDNLHLNKTGLERITVNLRLALGTFMKSGIQKVP